MSALPLPENVFKLPKRPKIIEKVAPPDQRSHAVLPIRAVTDKQLTDGQFRALAAICSYCNRAGITWVSQKRLATDMQVSQQAISKHMRALVSLGYLEVTRKGFRAEKPDTHRVIYDPNISQEDAIALTSSIEDTRPPELKREQMRETVPQNPPEEEFTEEQMAANRARLRELLSGLKPKNHTTHQPVQIGAILMPKARKKTASHSQPNTVVHEGGSHIQPRSQPNVVVKNKENIGIDKVLKVYEYVVNKRFNVCTTISETDMKCAAIMCEVGVSVAKFTDACETMPIRLQLSELCEQLAGEAAGF